MKIRVYLAMAAAALLMSNCNQEETPNQVQGGTNTLTAIIENGSRSAVTDGGIFSWTEGDKISVWNGIDFTEFTYSGSGNTFTSEEAVTSANTAIYPASDSHKLENGILTVNMAAEYAYGSTNAPMLAEGNAPGSTLNFKHLGGLMRFVVKGVPDTATSFIFTANSGITGEFGKESDGEGNPIIKASEVTNNNNSVTIYFQQEDVKDVMTFYIPLPTGTYSGYTVSVGGKSHTTDASITNTINRGTLLLMPTFTYVERETNLVKGDDNMVVLNDNETISLDVSDNEEVTVNVAEGATATLSLTAPEETTDGTVTISDGSAENTESQETSNGTLNVAVANVSTLNINTPTLTVKLASGSYDKVEALTAQQTLIIGEGVTIGELVVKGGNVKLEGNTTLSNPFVVNQDMTLDLGGKTLTATGSGIIVKKGAFTIKNGTLSAANTGCDAISIQGETDAEVKVNVGSDATLIAGDCCIVVPSANMSSNITVNTAGILEAKGIYNAIQLNGNAADADLNVTGGKITSTDGDAAGIYFPCSGTLTISDGEITGSTAVYIKSGNLEITGGTLVGNGQKKDYEYYGNGCHTTGDALVIDNCDYPYELGELSVSGGTFSSTNANAVGSYCCNGVTETKSGFITGGTFSDASAFNYLGENAEVTLGGDSEITEAISITGTAAIDLNSHTIENKTAASTTGLDTAEDECIVFLVKGEDANLTINATGGGAVKATGDGTKSYYNVAVWAMNNANVTINGGEFTNTADPDNDGCDLIYGRNGAKISITGGTFRAGAIRQNLGGGIYGVLNCKDKTAEIDQSTIKLSGGKFYEFGSEQASKVGSGEVVLLEDGYTWSEKNSEGYYSVVQE